MKQILRLQAIVFVGIAILYGAYYAMLGLTDGIWGVWHLGASAVICVAISGLSFRDMRRVGASETEEGDDGESD